MVGMASDMKQWERERRGSHPILVTTDVCARGIDILSIDHVSYTATRLWTLTPTAETF